MHTATQEDQIEEALGAGEANEELSNGFHISLKRSDFWLLHDAEWLNDKVRVMLFHGILLLYVYVCVADHEFLHESNY